MRSRLKSRLFVTLFVALGGLCVRPAAAADTMEITVTPNVTWGVSISSAEAGVGYDFGNVAALGETTVSTLPITIQNTGDVSEYFGISISNTSGSWTATTEAPSPDHFRMAALIQDSQPPAGNFSNASNFLSNPSFSGDAAGKFGQTSKTPPNGGTAHLWLRLEMPTDLVIGSTDQQTMTLTVIGQGN
jgi:hypothetical protein